ncbi:hypothetical protein [Derxia gummosa]|uniref:PEP-CTERM sorting domain-containing protein n=1 Tax=Derxia gummosa DSM 723 TaxID=1121388 RepID=A0A8B6X6Q1_9BURK|nr:hypothetical protein [Derxia gummosa]
MQASKLVLAALVVAACSGTASATAIDWHISGAGNLGSSTGADGSTTLSYDLTESGYGYREWSITGVAPEAGTYSFLWDYSGLHSWFSVTARLTTTTGATLVDAYAWGCCESPSNGFDYSGGYTFYNVNAGDTIGFFAGGSHYDYSQILRGSLTLTPTSQLFDGGSTSPVPEADPAAMFAIGMTAVGALVARRRRA